MRDVIITFLVLASLPLIIRKPFFGVLVWTWLGLMNPHRLCWGFALTMPFAQMVAMAIFAGWFLSKERKQIHWTPVSRLLAFWWGWMLLTSFFALEYPWYEWDRVWKIMLLTFIAIALLTSRERIHALVWVCVVSLGLYGVKGGIFTVLTGGSYSVWGPMGTFIGGNNEIGLALIMTIPLMRYLQLSSDSKMIKNAMLFSMITTLIAIIGTQSRGALLGMGVMVGYLAMKSRNKGALLLLLFISLPLIFLLMPESWYARMGTIETYEQDASAMGRINAWWTAFYIALDNPFTGGGFGVFRPVIFLQYAPDPYDFHDAHSIYFEVLGEHGFIGLLLFLAIGLGSLLTLKKVQKYAEGDNRLVWMRDLASMLYVSLIGYAASGAFLGLAYFDFYYTLIALTVALSVLAQRYRLEGVPEPEGVTAETRSRSMSNFGAPGPRDTVFSKAWNWYLRL